MNPTITTLPSTVEEVSAFLRRPLSEILGACHGYSSDDLRRTLAHCSFTAPVEFLTVAAARTQDPYEQVPWRTKRPILPGDLFSCLLGQVELGRKIMDDPAWPPANPEDACAILEPFYEAGKERGAATIKAANKCLLKALERALDDSPSRTDTVRALRRAFEQTLTYGDVGDIFGIVANIGLECSATSSVVKAICARMTVTNAPFVFRWVLDESEDIHRNAKIAKSWIDTLLRKRMLEFGWSFARTTRFKRPDKPDEHQVVLHENGKKVVLTHRPQHWHDYVGVKNQGTGLEVMVPPPGYRGEGRQHGNMLFHAVEFLVVGPPGSAMQARLEKEVI